MRPAPFPPSSYASPVSLPRRAVALALAIAFNVLLILALLGLAPPISGLRVRQGKPTIVTLLPDAAEEPAKTQSSEPKKAASQPRPEPAAPKNERVPPPAPTPPMEEATGPLKMVIITREDFAAADIGRMPRQPQGAASGAAANAGAATGATDGAARGPHGEKLYRAEWYRRPTQAELDFYVKGRGAPGAWATIACKTVSEFRVEDCVELEESPPGSRLAGAIRQAAWQFRVRPPRVGGKSMVGEWVSIRIDFTEKGDPDAR